MVRLGGDPLNVGIVGLGMVANAHARALQDLGERVRVIGAFSPTATRRQAFADEFGFPVVDSAAALFGEANLDAVIILTPPNARLDLVREAASRGVHMLLEKPLERTSAAARQIVEIAEQHQVRLGVVFQTRFRPASQAFKRLVDSREFGEIASVRIDVPWWRPQSYYDEPGRGTMSRDGGGVLISQAIHTLDLALWIAGPVEHVQAIAGTTRVHGMEGEDFVGGGMRFANGALGSLSATTAAYPGTPASIAIDFQDGWARLQGGTLSFGPRGGATEVVGDPSGSGAGADPMAFSHEWHRALISDFLDAVEQGRDPAVNGRQALGVHRLIDALMQSARTGSAARPAQVDNPITTGETA